MPRTTDSRAGLLCASTVARTWIMGNAVPVAPTAERAAELTKGLPSAATRAAELLQDASFVLVCLGSGTNPQRTARAPEQPAPAGCASEREARELDGDDLARDPAAYYGYWGASLTSACSLAARFLIQSEKSLCGTGARFNANRDTQRQDNAVVSFVNEWCGSGEGAGQEWYLFTTETDGSAHAAMRAVSSGPNGIRGLYECFGSTEAWRCASGCRGLYSPSLSLSLSLSLCLTPSPSVGGVPLRGSSSTSTPTLVRHPTENQTPSRRFTGSR